MKSKYTTVRVSDILFVVTMIPVLAFPGPSIFKALAIIVFFGYMMALKVMHWHDIRNNLHIVGSFLFLSYAFLSKYWALYPEGVSEQINNVLWTVLLSTAVSTYVIYRNLCVKDIVDRLIPIALLLCVNVVINGSFEGNRLSVGINANTFGKLSSRIVCFLFFQSKQYKWKSGILNMLSVVFALFVLLSGSRKALFMLVVYIVAFCMFEQHTKDKVKVFGKILGICIIFAIVYLCLIRVEILYTTIGHRVESLLLAIIGSAEGDASFITRMRMMETAWQIFLQYPLLGIGMNNFKYATSYNAYAHSNYYELGSCLGVVGLAIYYMPQVTYLKKSLSQWKKNVPHAIVPLVIIFASLINDYGNVTYFGLIDHTFLSLAIGLVMKEKLIDK